MQIHLHRAGHQSGPHTLNEVRDRLQSGTISLNDLAWYEGLPDWIPVSQLPGLGVALQAPPPLDNVSSLIRSPTTPPKRGTIILGAVAIILLSLLAFLGGLALLVGMDRGGSPLPGILLVLLSIVGLIVSIQFFSALSRNPSGRCQVCGQFRPTIKGSLNRHIGAVILMFHRSMGGHMCKECLSRVFWEYTPLTLAAGWWGMISFFITPVVLVNNVAFYVRSRFMK